MVKPQLIAFYLPQFHPIPENDLWWGAGFTEWTHTVAAHPLFPGHYQPHLPSELGCYDLRQPDTRMAQARLAASYGIDAFCYYHYWFEGKRLLERPFQDVLDSGKPDFPFCLCWANETWTRRYDGRSRDILQPQTYSDRDDLDHIRWLSRVFLDPRYLRIDGKPLFLVYRGRSLPSPARTLETWREESVKLGVGELFVCAVESNFCEERAGDPTLSGFDAAVEFQPDIFAHTIFSSLGRVRTIEGALNIARCLRRFSFLFSYDHLAKIALRKKPATYRRFACVTPSWDNTPRRRRGGAIIYEGSTPKVYEHWLQTVCEREIRGNGPGLIFLNAWNEWGEGCHLEPDQRYGRGYLEATLRAKENASRIPARDTLRGRHQGADMNTGGVTAT